MNFYKTIVGLFAVAYIIGAVFAAPVSFTDTATSGQVTQTIAEAFGGGPGGGGAGGGGASGGAENGGNPGSGEGGGGCGGCGSSGGGDTDGGDTGGGGDGLENQPAPICKSLSFNKNNVTVGTEVTLSLNSANANSASVNQGVGSIGVNGSKKVTQTSVGTKTYTATLRTNDGQNISCNASLTTKAKPTPAPVCTSLSFNKNNVTVGTDVTLSLKSTNANSASVNQGVGSIGVNGSKKVTQTSVGTKTYKATLTGADGKTVSCTADLTTKEKPTPAPKPPVCDLNPAGLQTINAGQSVTFNWTTNNADSVTFGVNNVVLNSNANNSGFAVTPDVGTTEYSLIAKKAGFDDAVCTTPVKVTQPETPLPVCTSFTGNGTTNVNLPVGGGNVDFAWATKNATKVTINNGVGQFINGETSTSKNVTADTTFVLTAANDDGAIDNTSCVVNVNVDENNGGDNLTCDSFSASPRTVEEGEQYTLNWNTTGADSVTINEGVGNQSADGSVTLTAPSVGRNTDITYTLTLSNGTETKDCAATVTIDNENNGGGGGGGSSSIRCDLDASDTSIKAGETVTLTWDNRRADELFIYREDEDDDDNLIFETDDEVNNGSITVRPDKDTEYIMVIERGRSDRTCRVDIDVDENDDVVVLQNRDQAPRVAGISLTQVPYTGFEAGPILTTIFYVLLAFWAMFTAYIFVVKRRPVAAVSVDENSPEALYKKKVKNLATQYQQQNFRW